MTPDELDPEARQLVDLARGARSPSDEQRDRAYQALMASLAGGGAALSAAKGTAAKVAAKSTLVWVKWAVPGVVAAALGVGAYVWKTQPPPIAVPHAVPAAPAPSAAQVAELAPPEVADSAAPEPSVPPAVKAPNAIKPTADDLVQELSLLHQALAESRSGHAARALELARQHAQRYPNSRLRVERDAIEVRSLCALGRAAEARKIADRLRARAPNSPVSAALADTCAGK